LPMYLGDLRRPLCRHANCKCPRSQCAHQSPAPGYCAHHDRSSHVIYTGSAALQTLVSVRNLLPRPLLRDRARLVCSLPACNALGFWGELAVRSRFLPEPERTWQRIDVVLLPPCTFATRAMQLSMMNTANRYEELFAHSASECARLETAPRPFWHLRPLTCCWQRDFYVPRQPPRPPAL